MSQLIHMARHGIPSCQGSRERRPSTFDPMPRCLRLIASCSAVGPRENRLLQRATDDAHWGRVMSFWTVVSCGAPSLGAITIGALGGTLGVAPGLAMIGLAGLAATAAWRLVFWQHAIALHCKDVGFRAGSENSRKCSMPRWACLPTIVNARKSPSRYVCKAANARAQGHGTFPQSVQTRDRQGNVGIRVV